MKQSSLDNYKLNSNSIGKKINEIFVNKIFVHFVEKLLKEKFM